MHLVRVFVATAAALALSLGLVAAPAQAAERTVWSGIAKVQGKLIFKVDVTRDTRTGRCTSRSAPTCKSTCPWKFYRKVITNSTGKARTRIYAPRRGNWYWRWVVPASGKFPKMYSSVWRTYRL